MLIIMLIPTLRIKIISTTANVLENKGKEKQYLLVNSDAYEKERVGDEKVIARVKNLCEVTDGEELNCLDNGSGMGLVPNHPA